MTLFFYFFFVNRRSDTDLGNTQSAPRGGESDCVLDRHGRSYFYFGLQKSRRKSWLLRRDVVLRRPNDTCGGRLVIRRTTCGGRAVWRLHARDHARSDGRLALWRPGAGASGRRLALRRAGTSTSGRDVWRAGPGARVNRRQPVWWIQPLWRPCSGPSGRWAVWCCSGAGLWRVRLLAPSPPIRPPDTTRTGPAVALPAAHPTLHLSQWLVWCRARAGRRHVRRPGGRRLWRPAAASGGTADGPARADTGDRRGHLQRLFAADGQGVGLERLPHVLVQVRGSY